MAETSLMDTNSEEHYIKRGDPTKPTYYILRRNLDWVGLFATYKIAAGFIRYALSKGWLPVIDMQNYSNAYLAPEKLGKENAWEYFFEQPLRIGVEEAYSGENVILSAENGVANPKLFESMEILENRNGVLTEWRMLRKLGLLQVKEQFNQESLLLFEKLFSPNDRVLGVHLRGTDYALKKPFKHPIVPPLEFAISMILLKLDKWKCNKIFFATEDKNILQVFKQVFGDLCVTIDREYVDYVSEEWITNCQIERDNDYFLKGKEYLLEALILSQCNSFISARCSGAIGVMMLADRFENTYFFNLGTYGVIGLE